MKVYFCNCFKEQWNCILLLLGKKFFEKLFELNENAINEMEEICNKFFHTNVRPTCAFDTKEVITVCFTCLHQKLTTTDISNLSTESCFYNYLCKRIDIKDLCSGCLNKATMTVLSKLTEIEM